MTIVEGSPAGGVSASTRTNVGETRSGFGFDEPVERMRHMQRMESLGRLSSGIAHEVNNLLTVIANYAALAADGLDGTSRVLADVEKIRNAAERGAVLTRRVLTYSRAGLGEVAAVPVGEVVEDSLTLLKGSLGRNVEIRTLLDPTCAPVRVDPVLLGQVLVNLAFNARDAMPDGGVVTIRTEPARSGMPSRPYVRIEVTDTGHGIPPAVIDRIFEPFFTTKPVGRGTGLGLAMVREVVAEIGGSVRVDSPLGGGTRFELLLPAA